MDSSEVGRYGTLRLVRRVDTTAVVATFPIDDDTVTFGRDPNCSVRLYYPSISALHAKIFFHERKAFLVVLGTNGLLVDGCQVFPTSGPSSGSSSPKTIPLPNNSEIEIHKKRFVFTYPPKDVRPLLVSTPARTSTHTSNGISNDMGTGTVGNTARKRTLRLSMIQSAEVFTPRPSADPRVNLKVLQSPLKPRAERSPVKRNLMDRLQEARDEEEEEEGQIVLVEGDHPRVVEEEKDLVILEDIPFSPQPQATPQIVISPQTQTQSLLNSFPVVPVPAPVTPRRPVGPSRASLHKAVLIRSAQRAILKAEMEKEEEEEEREVEEAAVAGGYGSSTEEEGEGENEDGEEEEEEEEEENQVSGWKKSLEMLRWPFRSGSTSREEEPPTHDGDEENHDAPDVPADAFSSDEEMENAVRENGSSSPEKPSHVVPPSTPAQTLQHPRPLVLGKFMTPQAATRFGNSRGVGRYSVGTNAKAGSSGPAGVGGGITLREREESAWGGARRVRLEPVWKVRDIVVPVREGGEGEAEEGAEGGEGDLRHGQIRGEMETPMKGMGRPRPSEAERKAIQDRRRSALTTPDTFFGGQAPGIGIGARQRTSAAFAHTTASPSKFASPRKFQQGQQRDDYNDELREEEEDIDTRVLLERMKETVEGMKRRRSEVPTGGFGGEFRTMGSMLGGEVGGDAIDVDRLGGDSEDEDGNAEESDKENERGTLEAGMEGTGSDEEEKLESASRTPVRSIPKMINPAPKTPHLDLKHFFVPAGATKTPSLKGVREMFQDGGEKVDPQTPKMDGMKEMFRERKVWATPAFEGVGEMMRTPSAYRMSVLEEEAEEEDKKEEEEAEEVPVKTRRGRSTPVAKPPSSTGSTSKSTTTRRKATPKSTAAKTPVTEGKSNFADDEATPGDVLGRVDEEDEDESAKNPVVARRGRSKAAKSDVEEDAGKNQRKARLIRGSRKVVDDIPEEPVDQACALPGRSQRTRTGTNSEVAEAARPSTRKAAAKPKATMMTTTDDEGTSSRSTRRLVKPPATADSGASTSEDIQVTAAASRPVRMTQARNAKTRGVSELATIVKKATRKGRAGAKSTDDESAGTGTGSRTKAIDVEDDPLDSIDAPGERIAAVRSRRVVRSRTATAEVVEEEKPADDVAQVETGKKASGKKVTSTKKAPLAVAPVPTESEDGVDKENAPSLDDEEPSKVKVTRAKKGTPIAVKEADIDDLPTTRTRATRTTRVRK